MNVNIQGDYIYRLGNYTLLEASINNKLDNTTAYKAKLVECNKSSYKLSNEYCNYEQFDPKAVANRQNKLAKIAKSTWKSAFIQSVI